MFNGTEFIEHKMIDFHRLNTIYIYDAFPSMYNAMKV
jgi:hypothetical protein